MKASKNLKFALGLIVLLSCGIHANAEDAIQKQICADLKKESPLAHQIEVQNKFEPYMKSMAPVINSHAKTESEALVSALTANLKKNPTVLDVLDKAKQKMSASDISAQTERLLNDASVVKNVADAVSTALKVKASAHLAGSNFATTGDDDDGAEGITGYVHQVLPGEWTSQMAVNTFFDVNFDIHQGSLVVRIGLNMLIANKYAGANSSHLSVFDLETGAPATYSSLTTHTESDEFDFDQWLQRAQAYRQTLLDCAKL